MEFPAGATVLSPTRCGQTATSCSLAIESGQPVSPLMPDISTASHRIRPTMVTSSAERF